MLPQPAELQQYQATALVGCAPPSAYLSTQLGCVHLQGSTLSSRGSRGGSAPVAEAMLPFCKSFCKTWQASTCAAHLVLQLGSAHET